MDRPLFGILIPVYNASGSLNELIREIKNIVAVEDKWEFRILVVDDGSEPPLVIENQPDIYLVRHECNSGKGRALKTGFAHLLRQSRLSAVITIDADMQHPPEHIPQFVDMFLNEAKDLVIGARHRDRKIMPFHRIISNAITSWIISVMIGQRVPDTQCGYRLYSTRLLNSVKAEEERFHLESEFVIRSGWQKYSIGSVSIPTIYNNAPSAIRHLPDTLNFVSVVLRLTWRRIIGHV